MSYTHLATIYSEKIIRIAVLILYTRYNKFCLQDVTTLSSHNLTDEIRAALLRAQTLSIRFPTLSAELEVLMLAAEEKEGILYNLTPTYKEKYLANVEKHVEELSAKAAKYKRYLLITKLQTFFF